MWKATLPPPGVLVCECVCVLEVLGVDGSGCCSSNLLRWKHSAGEWTVVDLVCACVRVVFEPCVDGKQQYIHHTYGLCCSKVTFRNCHSDPRSLLVELPVKLGLKLN